MRVLTHYLHFAPGKSSFEIRGRRWLRFYGFNNARSMFLKPSSHCRFCFYFYFFFLYWQCLRSYSSKFGRVVTILFAQIGRSAKLLLLLWRSSKLLRFSPNTSQTTHIMTATRTQPFLAKLNAAGQKTASGSQSDSPAKRGTAHLRYSQ